MREKYLNMFKLKHSLRFHMFLIVSLSFSCGILINYFLYRNGIDLIWVRLIVSIPFSYLMFFVFTKFWIYLVFPKNKFKKKEYLLENTGELIVDIPVDTSVNVSDSWKGSGGGFSGGGVSESWGLPEIDLDADTDSAPLILLLILVAVLVLIFGSVVYLLYISPQMLAEIALENAISIGIIKSAKKSNTPWHQMLFKKTIIPFVLILLLSVVSTFFIQKYLPHIQKLSQIKISDFKLKKEISK